jgi:hypothetical protein
MRRDAEQGMTLGTRLEDEMDVAVLEVAHTAVDEPRRPARRPPGEIRLVHQRHREPARYRFVGDSAPGDAAADHEEVELPAAERFQALRSRRDAGLH